MDAEPKDMPPPAVIGRGKGIEEEVGPKGGDDDDDSLLRRGGLPALLPFIVLNRAVGTAPSIGEETTSPFPFPFPFPPPPLPVSVLLLLP